MRSIKPQPPISSRRGLRFLLLSLACLLLFVCGNFPINKNSIEASSKKRGVRKQTPVKTPVKTRVKNGRKRPTPAPVPAGGAIGEESPEKRNDWFNFKRAYPNNSIPPDGRRKAWESRPGRGLGPLNDLTWRSIGPSPTTSAFVDNWGVTSGRINSIAVSPADPQVILLGTSTGGVWRSTDGGINFSPVTDTQVDLAVGSIAFSKSNPNVIYSGMGDTKNAFLGSGVLKTTNGGVTWVRVSDGSLPSPGTVSKIQVDPTNPDRVYLAQQSRLSGSTRFSSGFFVSSNGGVSWRMTLAGIPEDLVIDPINPQTLYLGMSRVDESDRPPAGLYRSIDGGNSWTRIFTVPYVDNGTFDLKVAVSPASPQTIYVYTGGVIFNSLDVRVVVSKDGGSTWNNLGSAGLDTAQFGYNTYIFADPTNANTVYVGTRDVFKSTNGGVNWTNLTNNFSLQGRYNPNNSNSHPDQHTLTFSPTNPNEIYIGNDGGISKSTDGGVSFRSLNASLTLSQFNSIALHPVNPSISYGGTQDNGTQRRLGSTSKWEEFVSGDGGNVVINPLNPNTIFTTFVFGSVFRLVDDGETDFDVVATEGTFDESRSNPRIAFYPPFVGNGVDSKLYFGTWRLFISNNLGNTWAPPAGEKDLTKGNRDVLSAIAVSSSNTNVIYTGSAQGRAMASTNEGRNWTDVTPGLPNRFISDIKVDPANPSTAYLAVSGYGTGHIFKTTNNGGEWKDISNNLPDIPVNALLIDPIDPNTLYAGTDIGVFRLPSGKTRWESFNEGMPPAVVNAFSAPEDSVEYEER